MTFGDRIKDARIAKGLTQEQLAEMIGVAKNTVTGYEKGTREPDVTKIKRLIECLGIPSEDLLGVGGSVDTKITPAERAHVYQYRELDSDGREVVDAVMALEHRRVTRKPQTKARHARTRSYRVYDDATAAGEPLYAESSYTEIALPPGQVPNNASYGVRICGTSMEPTIPDGSIAWVENTQDAHNGDIVIAWVDGEGMVCKRAEMDEGHITCLTSDNPAGRIFEGGDLNDLRIYGRVVGHTPPSGA